MDSEMKRCWSETNKHLNNLVNELRKMNRNAPLEGSVDTASKKIGCSYDMFVKGLKEATETGENNN